MKNFIEVSLLLIASSLQGLGADAFQFGLSLAPTPLFTLGSNKPHHPHYATHPQVSPYNSHLDSCLSPRYQVLQNFYGDYFKPGVMCFTPGGSSPLINVRGGPSDSPQGDSFSSDGFVLKSFSADHSSNIDGTCKDGVCSEPICDKVPDVCNLLKSQAKVSESHFDSAASESSFFDTMRENINGIYSLFNRRSFTSTSSSTSRPTFPLFSLFSSPPFSSDDLEPQPTVFQPSLQMFSDESRLKEQFRHCPNGRCPGSVSSFLTNGNAKLPVAQSHGKSRPSPPSSAPDYLINSDGTRRPSHDSLPHRHPTNQDHPYQSNSFLQAWSGYGNPLGYETSNSAPQKPYSPDHFNLDGYHPKPTHLSVCAETEGVAYPLMGISAVTGKPVVIKQHYPVITQPVFFRKCVSTTYQPSGCKQQFLPVAFIVKKTSFVSHSRPNIQTRKLDDAADESINVLNKTEENKGNSLKAEAKSSDSENEGPEERSSFSFLNPFASKSPSQPLKLPFNPFQPTQPDSNYDQDFILVESGCKRYL